MVKREFCKIKDKDLEKVEEVVISQSKKDKGKIAGYNHLLFIHLPFS